MDAAANSNGSIYKIVNDGTEAQRVNVKYGRSSVRTIEILDGLQPGDKVILSDMSEVEKADRVHLTDTRHLRKQYVDENNHSKLLGRAIPLAPQNLHLTTNLTNVVRRA